MARNRFRAAKRLLTIIRAQADETAVRVRMELAAAYPGTGVDSFVRTFTLDKTGTPTLTIADTFRWTNDPKPVTERFTTLVKPVVQVDGSVLIRGENGAVTLRAASAPPIGRLQKPSMRNRPKICTRKPGSSTPKRRLQAEKHLPG